MHKFLCLLHVALATCLSGVLPAQHLAPKADAARTSTQSTPEGLTDSQWTSIRAAYEAGRHKVTKVDGVYQARNPGQGWLTRFEDGGFAVKPDSGDWTWGLELQSYGIAGEEQEVGTPSKAQANGGRMSYRWDAPLEEWYVNDTRGLEHGYTVQQRPARKANDTEDRRSKLQFRRFAHQEPDIAACHGPSLMRDPARNRLVISSVHADAGSIVGARSYPREGE